MFVMVFAMLSYFSPHIARACPEIAFPFRDSDLPLPEMTCINLRPQLQHHYSLLIDQELGKYPNKIIDEHIHKIIIVEKLYYDGVSLGGTTVDNLVVLAVGIEEPTQDSDVIIRSILHAEISSIVFRATWSSYDEECWSRALPEHFAYPNNPLEYIRLSNVHEQLPATVDHDDGFLTEYARTCLENDFNAFASALFLGRGSVLASTSRAVSDKARMVISAYERLCPSMNFEYFAELVLRLGDPAQ